MIGVHAYIGVGSENGEAMRPALSALLLSSIILLPCSAVAAPAWDYMGGANDDEGWELLSPDYTACKEGSAQSPVVIADAKAAALAPLVFDYHASDVVAQRREKTLIVQFKEGNNFSQDGTTFSLRQIRFHTPSEHGIHAQALPLEMHFIHQHGADVLIVAVLVQVGEENAALQSIIENLPEKNSPEKLFRFDPSALLPLIQGFYAYSGSLSWPPCTEDVAWRVMKVPLTLSQAQLKKFTALLGRNARLPQPLYFRNILETTE